MYDLSRALQVELEASRMMRIERGIGHTRLNGHRNGQTTSKALIKEYFIVCRRRVGFL